MPGPLGHVVSPSIQPLRNAHRGHLRLNLNTKSIVCLILSSYSLLKYKDI